MTKHKLGKIESPLGKMDEDTNYPPEHKSPLETYKKTKSPLKYQGGKKVLPPLDLFPLKFWYFFKKRQNLSEKRSRKWKKIKIFKKGYMEH